MNKKLIAAAVMAGLAAPMAAQADAGVYGLAQLELNSYDAGSGSKTLITDAKNTRVGVKWSEDLGGGLKAIGQFEWGPNLLNSPSSSDSCSLTNVASGTATDTAACSVTDKSGIYAREMWLGLKGGFGELHVGTIHSAYKYAGGVKYDPFVATQLQARTNAGMLGSSFGQNGYMGNSIGYYNKFGMVNFALTYSPVEASDANNTYSGSKGDITLAATFGFNGGEVGLAYAKDKYATGTTGTEGPKNTKIFGKYAFGTSTILGQYEKHTTAAGGASDTKTYFLGYQLKLPAMNLLAIQIGQTKKDTGSNAKTSYAAVGVRHSFSKKTSAYLGWRKTSPDGSSDTKVITLGLTEKF
jgi:predicted porin